MFRGLAHLHGTQEEPEEMILTATDFGEAYLTQDDGWARRFLVKLFENYTVLFVGYSHTDLIIMSYLSRSLSRVIQGNRYVMFGEKSDDREHWRSLGIEPIQFPQYSNCDFDQLDKSIHGLAEYFQRGILGQQAVISSIAQKPPPILNREEADTITIALEDIVTARFFTNSAEDKCWINWLDQHNHLAGVFGHSEPSEVDQNLALWIAEKFLYEGADTLFLLLEKPQYRITPLIWESIVRSLGKIDCKDLKVFRQWVSLIANTIPSSVTFCGVGNGHSAGQ